MSHGRSITTGRKRLKWSASRVRKWKGRDSERWGLGGRAGFPQRRPVPGLRAVTPPRGVARDNIAHEAARGRVDPTRRIQHAETRALTLAGPNVCSRSDQPTNQLKETDA
jgi:hypothetical protein